MQINLIHLYKRQIMLILVFSFNTEAITLKTAYFESQPRFIFEKKEWSGICHDVFKFMNSKLKDIKIIIPKYQTPLKRILKTYSFSKLDVIGCIDRSILDTQDFELLEVPLYKVSSVLIMRDKKRYKLLSNLIGKKIGVIRGSQAEAELKAYLSKKEIQEVGTLKSLIFMLERERIDGIYDNTLGLFYLLNQRKLLFKYRSILKTKNYSHYIAISKSLPIEVKEKLLRVLKQMELDGVLDEIYWKYLGV